MALCPIGLAPCSEITTTPIGTRRISSTSSFPSASLSLVLLPLFFFVPLIPPSLSNLNPFFFTYYLFLLPCAALSRFPFCSLGTDRRSFTRLFCFCFSFFCSSSPALQLQQHFTPQSTTYLSITCLDSCFLWVLARPHAPSPRFPPRQGPIHSRHSLESSQSIVQRPDPLKTRTGDHARSNIDARITLIYTSICLY